MTTLTDKSLLSEGDNKPPMLEKHLRLFKQSVFLEDFQADIYDFDNNDDDGGGKNDDHGSDNVGKKKESTAKDVWKKDGVNAEKDGVNNVQDGEAHVNEEPEDMFEKETLTQWIEKNIDWFGEEDLFVWPRAVQPLSAVCPQRVTKAIIEGTIDEEHQWKVFSDEISEQFKHDVSSISLSEVDLAFFPIYASGHFYVVVFHLKSPSAMIILDNSDCEETYNSKYKAVCGPLWDFGLCEESDEQVSMLRRMRFKIAAKILLNEFNIHLEKMFDLAFKFETENDEQKRISIIVNAIKNRNEREPAKTE
ncbi:hypothetical protein Tco_0734161 [Tanacetum coccineum]